MITKWSVDFQIMKKGTITLEGVEHDDTIYVYWKNSDGKGELVDELPRQKLIQIAEQISSFISAIESAEDMDDE